MLESSVLDQLQEIVGFTPYACKKRTREPSTILGSLARFFAVITCRIINVRIPSGNEQPSSVIVSSALSYGINKAEPTNSSPL